MEDRKQHQQIHLRIYRETDPELYQWYQELSGATNKSTLIKEALRAGLQAQNGEREQTTTAANAPQVTAAINTEELVAALLPEMRAVVLAALATVKVTGATAPPEEEHKHTAEMEGILDDLEESLLLDL